MAKLLKSTFAAGGMTLLSRLSGFVRDILFAHLIGTTPLADAFFVAFRIPNFLRRVFGEGAFSQAFVPVFTDYRTHHSPEDTRRFLERVQGALASALLLVSIAGVLLAPVWVALLAPGFLANPEKYHVTVMVLRITFPYLLIVSLVAMGAAILNTVGSFAAPAFTPVLLNLCLIVAAGLVAPHLRHPVMALAWGVIAGGLAQWLFQAPFLYRVGALTRPRLDWDHAGVRRIFRLMVPSLFGASVAQINLVVDTVLASFLVTGSVSWLYYANRLLEFPLGVFGIALGSVILPALSDKHVRGRKEDFSHTIDWGLRWVLVITAPAAVGLAVLARPLLATLFAYGAFHARDVEMAARALIAFSLGLPAFVLIKVLAPAFYAREDTRTPVRIGVVALIANVGFNLILVWPLAHAGLALATSLSAVLNASLLYRAMVRAGVYVCGPGWRGFLLRVVGGSFAMGVVLVLGCGPLGLWMGRTALARAAWLLAWVMTGIVVYATVLTLTRFRLPMSPRGEGESAYAADPSNRQSP